MFEEAAGISRFKAKKVEAQRRLERVEQNLLRLSDIVEEVENRLKTVRGAGEQGPPLPRIHRALATAAHADRAGRLAAIDRKADGDRSRTGRKSKKAPAAADAEVQRLEARPA